MTYIGKALLDPAQVFDAPADVLKAEDLTREQKIEILRRWEYDAREQQVATEENMPGENSDLLSLVLEALNSLGVYSEESDAPTKQGGA